MLEYFRTSRISSLGIPKVGLKDEKEKKNVEGSLSQATTRETQRRISYRFRGFDRFVVSRLIHPVELKGRSVD